MWDMVFSRITETVLAAVNPAQRFFWPFLVANLIMLVAVCFWRLPKDSGRLAEKTLENAFPKDVYQHRSALLDYRYAAINALFSVLIQCVAGLGTVVITRLTTVACGAIFGVLAPFNEVGFGVCLAYTFLMIVLFDTANFFAHYLQHRVPALWEFHKVHHSAEVLTPITVLRMHPVDDLITASTHMLTFGLANGLFLYQFGGTAMTLTVWGTNIFFFTYFAFGYHLRHSHVWVMFPKGVREVFSSPALHLVHHSKASQHWDKNFAPVFTLWDRLFGTLYQPAQHETIEFGIADEDARELTSVPQLYLTPFRKALGVVASPGLQSRFRKWRDGLGMTLQRARSKQPATDAG